MTMALMAILGLAALWFLYGILRDEHRKSQREIRDIERLHRDFARVIRQSKP